VLCTTDVRNFARAAYDKKFRLENIELVCGALASGMVDMSGLQEIGTVPASLQHCARACRGPRRTVDLPPVLNSLLYGPDLELRNGSGYKTLYRDLEFLAMSNASHSCGGCYAEQTGSLRPQLSVHHLWLQIIRRVHGYLGENGRSGLGTALIGPNISFIRSYPGLVQIGGIESGLQVASMTRGLDVCDSGFAGGLGNTLLGRSTKEALQRCAETVRSMVRARLATLLNDEPSATAELFATCLAGNEEKLALVTLRANVTTGQVQWQNSDSYILPGRGGSPEQNAIGLLLSVLSAPKGVLRSASPLAPVLEMHGLVAVPPWESAELEKTAWQGQLLLGEGRFGCVYSAGAGNVIKVVNDDYEDEVDFRAEFATLKALAALPKEENARYLFPVLAGALFDAKDPQRVIALRMEVTGVTLSNQVRFAHSAAGDAGAYGAYVFSLLRDVGTVMCDALNALHAHGIVHGDVCSANILVLGPLMHEPHPPVAVMFGAVPPVPLTVPLVSLRYQLNDFGVAKVRPHTPAISGGNSHASVLQESAWQQDDYFDLLHMLAHIADTVPAFTLLGSRHPSATSQGSAVDESYRDEGIARVQALGDMNAALTGDLPWEAAREKVVEALMPFESWCCGQCSAGPV
jgi:hypothetical protein